MVIRRTGKPNGAAVVRTGVRNQRKRAILAVLEPGGWMTPAMIAALAPAPSVHWLLKRYWRWGLLHRRIDREGRLLYAISDKGRERLKWLRRSGAQGRVQ
jgi:hypothetical protein